MGKLREQDIAQRIGQKLLNEPQAMGVLLLGAAHPLLSLPSGIETRVYHRIDCFEKRMLPWFEKYQMALFCSPDDFGHIPGALHVEQ